MEKGKKRPELFEIIREVTESDPEVLFAYLYGSFIYSSNHIGSDIDLAIYLKPSDIKEYIKKEGELTSSLITKLRADKIDLRILNVLPFRLQYNILKEGVLIFVRDEAERVDFDTRIMNRFFELKPYLQEYRRMLLLRIEAGT